MSTSLSPASAPSRPLALALLATLPLTSAACVLAALATFAQGIITAAATLRQCEGKASERFARTTLEAASADPFDSLPLANGGAAGVVARAFVASWWFSTPCDVVASFWRCEVSRRDVEAQSRGALLEVDALRAELRAQCNVRGQVSSDHEHHAR